MALILPGVAWRIYTVLALMPRGSPVGSASSFDVNDDGLMHAEGILLSLRQSDNSGGKRRLIPDRGALRTRMKNMKLIYFSLVLAGTVLLFTSCERKSETVVEARVEEPIKAEPVSATTTLETTGLERAIEAYRANPTEQNGAGVDKAFAELDLEIAELKQKGATATGNEKIETDKKLSDLQAYRNKQRANYIGEKAKAAAASAGEAIKNATEDVGRAIEKTGEAVKKAVD